MSLIDDIKAKMDKDGDGKLNKADLDTFNDNDGKNKSMIERLKAIADQNDDGRLSMDDIKNFDFNATKDSFKKNM